MIKRLLFILLLLFVTVGNSQTNPLISKDTIAQKKWVDSIMSKLTIDQKIGQLFMVAAYSNKDEKHVQHIQNLIDSCAIGGLIFMQGTPEKQAFLTNLYQQQSKIPLLIGFDGEWGLDMRLTNSYKFPWNMTLGAIRDNDLLKEYGEKLGSLSKRMGIQLNFAPVVDINTNPNNPIIGNRSFGESRENVTEKAIAFIGGMQGENILASAKHFPGHGDTDTDSHKTLPELNVDLQRLDSIELYPYKKLINNNLTGIMVAHLSVNALEPDSTIPTSLSYNVVTNLLKNQLHFNGLIITDALNMKGVSTFASPGEIDLEAFKAGNDVLLFPEDVSAGINQIKNAIKDSIISVERLNYSVRKILMAKYWAGLNTSKYVNLTNLEADLHTVSNELIDRKLIENSITLLKNDNYLVPLKNLDTLKIAYVKFGDDDSNSFVDMLKNYTKVDEISDENLDGLINKLRIYNLVIVGYHKSNANPWKEYHFQENELVWLQEIARVKPTILDVFTSPYSLLQPKTFTNFKAVICSFQNSKLAQELSAQAIFGALEIKGQLPVSIENQFNEGTGFITTSLKRLAYSIPEAEGMDSEKLKKIDSLANYAINKQMTPGMQILVARNGTVIYNKTFGYQTYDSILPVLKNDVYDVASLTKVLATLPLLVQLEEQNVFKLKTTLGKLVTKLKHTNKRKLTVEEVLSHNAALKAWIPFYLKTLDSVTKKPSEKYYRKVYSADFSIKVADSLFLATFYKDSIFNQISTAEQYTKKEYKYSDLGYFIFKEFIENYYHNNLDKLTQEHFYKSLGANRTGYLPLEKFKIDEIVPTEDDYYFRYQKLRGYVHDMGAAMQGGIGGHAGLFSNANDVAKMMQLYLQKGYYGGKRYFQPETFDRFNHRYYADDKNRRGLGFDKPQIDPKEEATCGCVSDASFGHSGFTGTYTWADPVSGIVYVFLSNRTYPTMKNNDLAKYNIRTQIQQYIQNAIIN